jgi:drug/metabolite transporter (DMT)-like permease
VRNFVLFFCICALGTAGELCISRAMKQIGEVKQFRPRAVASVLLQAMRIRWLWSGLAMMALAFFALLTILSAESVSFVVPVTAINYVIAALGGMVFLGEKVSARRWTGVVVITVGVTLVLLAK